MDPRIAEAKSSFEQAVGRLRHSFANVPDDRINWSPSPTSRTPVHIVAHTAAAMKSIHEMVDGRPFGVSTTAEADAGFREWERKFDTRDQVLGMLDENAAAFTAWLDRLTPDKLDTQITLPFGLGTAPMQAGLDAAAVHVNMHTAQIDYIQTIYGDQDWHL